MRLKSKIAVQALIRRCEAQGAQAYVLRKGSEEAGAVFIKINRLDGTCTILSPSLTGAGERAWTKPQGDVVDDAKAAEYFARQIRFDPDIWIVEIEDREGRTFVDEPIV